MRISELASRVGVSLSAVKYYQREGLLPPGERGAPNQVTYGEQHVQRVRLIRALIDTGGLTIAATKSVIAALDAPDAPIVETFAVAQHALGPARNTGIDVASEQEERIIELIRSRGWRVSPDNPGIGVTARVLDGFQAIDFDAGDEYLEAYADAAALAASADLRALATRTGRDATAELMVVGTVLGDPLFAGLRRLAQEDATHDVFPASDPDAQDERDNGATP